MSPRGTADRSQMLVEEFEEIERAAPETVWLEFVNGRLAVKAASDGNHGEIVMWLFKRCMQERPGLALHSNRGLKVEAGREGRVRPDGALVPERHFVGHGEWSEPDGVLMTVEVTSHDRDAELCHLYDKRDAYAAAGIPVHLFIDREDLSVTVFSQPEDGRYRSSTSRPFGADLELPDPVGFTLPTEELKDLAR